jgi:hypothetical protein
MKVMYFNKRGSHAVGTGLSVMEKLFFHGMVVDDDATVDAANPLRISKNVYSIGRVLSPSPNLVIDDTTRMAIGSHWQCDYYPVKISQGFTFPFAPADESYKMFKGYSEKQADERVNYNKFVRAFAAEPPKHKLWNVEVPIVDQHDVADKIDLSYINGSTIRGESSSLNSLFSPSLLAAHQCIRSCGYLCTRDFFDRFRLFLDERYWWWKEINVET